jgi:hypothetical protein
MNVAVATMADATATRMALCMTPPGFYKNRAAARTPRGRDCLWFGAFEKRKMFQCVYCSIGTPSYISSTRSICVSRL